MDDGRAWQNYWDTDDTVVVNCDLGLFCLD